MSYVFWLNSFFVVFLRLISFFVVFKTYFISFVAFKTILFSVYEYFACVYVCASCACLVPKKPWRKCQDSVIGITDGCEIPCRWWESNSDPLQEHQVPTSQTPLQPLGCIFNNKQIKTPATGSSLIPNECWACAWSPVKQRKTTSPISSSPENTSSERIAILSKR